MLEASVEVPAAPLVARSATRFVIRDQTSRDHQTDRLAFSAARSVTLLATAPVAVSAADLVVVVADTVAASAVVAAAAVEARLATPVADSDT